MRSHRFPNLPYALLLGLTLTACGDDGGGNSGGDTGGASTAASTNPTSDPTTDTQTSTSDPTSTSTPGSSSDSTTDTDSADSSSSTGAELECPYTPIEGKQGLGLELVAGGFNTPLFVIGDPVDTDTLYVLEKGGAIKRLAPDDTTAPEEDWFSLDVYTTGGDEMGLLGMAFHPDHATNGLIYLLHSDTASSWRITEFAVESGSVDAGSAREILGMAQPAGNHNGGMIQFGPDGMLYVSVGDGGPQNDGCGNGQNGQTHHGSILRIDVEADGNGDASTACGTCNCPAVDGFDYTVPEDNPFVGDDAVDDAIYAYGFRNPWRFSFDPEDGKLFVADVGQGGWEEVDLVEAGGNYGWGNMEGAHCNNQSECDETAAPGTVNEDGFHMPIAEYDRSGGECSVTGLGVYRSCEVPAFDGLYFYADLCTGRIFAVSAEGGTIEDLGAIGQIPNNPELSVEATTPSVTSSLQPRVTSTAGRVRSTASPLRSSRSPFARRAPRTPLGSRRSSFAAGPLPSSPPGAGLQRGQWASTWIWAMFTLSGPYSTTRLGPGVSGHSTRWRPRTSQRLLWPSHESPA